MAKARKSPEARVEGFNRTTQLGTKVLYTSSPGARAKATWLTSQAWVLGGHTPVVMVDGVRGCVALDALIVLASEEPMVLSAAVSLPTGEEANG